MNYFFAQASREKFFRGIKTFFSATARITFLLSFFAVSVASVLAAPYGQGEYGGGDYNVGQLPASPTPTPSPGSGDSGSGNSGSSSSGSSGSSSHECTNQKPQTVPDLFQINAKKDTLTLFFAPVVSDRDRYYVSYGTKSGDWQYGFEFENSESGVVSVDVQALQPNTAYYFRVRAGNGCAAGEWSNELSARTGQRVPSYRWSSLPAVVSNTVRQAVRPSPRAATINAGTASPSPVPTTAPSENTQSAPTQPAGEGTQAPASPAPGNTSSSAWGKISNFFKGLFGK